ncbi:MAG: DUF2147 domain-containing protein [Gammaproteobacteria bacterium]|jgi:hypothetical protein|nr:DUF2147 domain-containing protein [Gammaproteobacteria bacterium]MBT5154537.1 DUF2147 domain-containing protein [Gammaproteobacteria bacterium]MBT5722942.1 DUF2147 domain-containing protein [Gammaproteobacteria bacterium]MBT6583525.1 DUF2147 domain-containing protein [Gammaproteobacteria bacterium]MBT6890519.1 DUF2147 domain-containing protein [Gammaproteobacteria bacterium]
MKPYRTLLIAALLMMSQAFAGDISGYWKLTTEPGWIEINLKQGKGVVARNDKFPERVGREFLKNLVARDSEEGPWQGQIFIERLGEYKDAEISMAKPDRLNIKVKLGFMSRTLEWHRVDTVPVN